MRSDVQVSTDEILRRLIPPEVEAAAAAADSTDLVGIRVRLCRLIDETG
jgi:hypothetical protein